MTSPNLPDDLRYQLLKKLEQTPDISQRELAIELGMSEKAAVTLRFLERKQQQYERLKQEIANLEREISRNH